MLYLLIATIGHISDMGTEWIPCNCFHGCTGFGVPSDINIHVLNKITCTKTILPCLFPILNDYSVDVQMDLRYKSYIKTYNFFLAWTEPFILR